MAIHLVPLSLMPSGDDPPPARYAAGMDTPSLPRRVRHARPETRVRRLMLTEADLLLFEAIARHGPLPSSYLYEFTRHMRRDRTHLQNRLTEFYNGDNRGGYLTRPQQQFAAFEARYQHLVYDLAPRGLRAVAERAATRSLVHQRTDPFVHRLMTACVSASFELCAPTHALRHISFPEIITRHPESPAARARVPLALPAPSTDLAAVIPDLVFGLEYPSAGFRFFAVECDRHTESIERRNLRWSAFARKLASYAALLHQGTYRTWWGVPNLNVLIVTTSAVHAANILLYIQRHIDPAFHTRFGIASAPIFGANWRVPKEPLTSMLAEPWQTPAGLKNFAQP